ncbi:MAG: single-stranded DNA-binding protein [Bacteroidetes bacterium GWF2_38_335]|nr:MAG: single-stranded DNA-binding protein [Bacteroidetes bacterium GWF2_38_335]OFY77287.1 MAG: single-stranded DNA-binding protein [Bacteroidetes bacterium RIFOXYA12_FULL_38_20]HBS85708.1 single-stranded DNA-binding protein [Bacteroidales bacterium]
MNNLRNRVQIIGHLGQDPEIKKIEGKGTLAKMNIATNDSYKGSDGKTVKETQWHNVTAWGKTADLVEKYLKKGNEVAIEGKLSNRTYEDKEGVKKYVTEIIVNEILFLKGGK